jgi:hypothetical protein
MGPTAIREAVILRRIDERQDRELLGDIGANPLEYLI